MGQVYLDDLLQIDEHRRQKQLLADKLGTEGVVKFGRALEQNGVIEAEYRDVEAGT